MNTLPLKLRIGGFDLEQVERVGSWAIYRQTKRGRFIAYEVFKVHVEPSRAWPDGHVTPKHETYASPSDWGDSAWTCTTLERARQRMQDGLRKATKPPGNTPPLQQA